MITPQCEECGERVKTIGECTIVYDPDRPAGVALCHKECALARRGSRHRAEWFAVNDNLEKWYELFPDRRAREIGLLAHRWVNQQRYFVPRHGFVTIWDAARKRKIKDHEQAG